MIELKLKEIFDDQKLLELGIEIVAAMKANAFGVPIEDGRIMALEDTEPDRFSDQDKIGSTPEDQAFIKKYTQKEKERLHKQANFVARITLEKILHLIS